MSDGPVGRFLELALPAPDLLASWQCLRALGFAEAPTTDARPEGYAVLGDGRCALGLYAELPQAELVFVRDKPLYEWPDGLPLRVVEARTFSPVAPPSPPPLGWFSEVMLPAADPAAAAADWEALGFVCLGAEASPLPHLALVSDTLNLGLYPPGVLAQAGLLFEHAAPESLQPLLEQAGLHARRPPAGLPPTSVAFALPQGTPVWVIPEPG